MALIFSLSSIPNLTPPVHVQNADKAAHLLEYGGLGFLFARAWRGSRFGGRRRFLVFLLTVLVGVSVAALDETYQGSVPGRQRSLADLGADLIGLAVIGGAVAARGERRKRVKNGREGGET